MKCQILKIILYKIFHHEINIKVNFNNWFYKINKYYKIKINKNEIFIKKIRFKKIVIWINLTN
jgi:hypothetical protein